VRRAGLDYWERVPLRLWESFEDLDQALPELGEPFFVSPDSERTIWEVSYPERVVLLFGSETAGLPAAIRERRRDRLVYVPMNEGIIRSLNLSTTVGIAVYEVLRQRREKARAGSCAR